MGPASGGGTLAYALRESRRAGPGDGNHRARGLPAHREEELVVRRRARGRYKNSAAWRDASTGTDFVPGNYHPYVGGSTKLYRATLPRFGNATTGEIEHVDGVSPRGRCLTSCRPYYCQAERMFVAQQQGEDHRSVALAGLSFPGVPHEAR